MLHSLSVFFPFRIFGTVFEGQPWGNKCHVDTVHSYIGPSLHLPEAQQSRHLTHPQHLPSYPKTAKSCSNWNVHPHPPGRGASSGRAWRPADGLSGANWWTPLGKSLTHSEQPVHLRGTRKNQKLKQVINIPASLPRRGLMLISLSHLCFLFSWHSLIFHEAGNSMFDQNSLKLSNEFQLPVYLVFLPAFPPGHSKRFPK